MVHLREVLTEQEIQLALDVFNRNESHFTSKANTAKYYYPPNINKDNPFFWDSNEWNWFIFMKDFL